MVKKMPLDLAQPTFHELLVIPDIGKAETHMLA